MGVVPWPKKLLKWTQQLLDIFYYYVDERAIYVGIQKTQGTKSKQYDVLRTIKVLTRNESSKQIDNLFIIHLLLTPSERKMEVALGLTFEHHLLARPSLASVEIE